LASETEFRKCDECPDTATCGTSVVGREVRGRCDCHSGAGCPLHTVCGVADQFLEVLSAIGEHGSVACVHAENEEIIKPLLARASRSFMSSSAATASRR